MYFKTWKKKKKHLFGALQITSTHILTLILRLSSFLTFAKKKRKNHAPATRTLLIVSSVPENDFWNLVSLPTLLQIPLFYTHDLHICLAFSRTLPFSLSFFSPSLPDLSIYLLYLPVVHSSASAPIFYGFFFFLRYVHFSRQACGERE